MTFTLTNNAEGGTSGTTVSGGNSGGSSGSAFDGVSITTGTLTFDNTHAAHGSLAYEASVSAASSSYAFWSTSISLTGATVWFRLYLYCTANPANNVRIFSVIAAGNTLSAGVNLLTAGTLRTVYGSGSTTDFTSSTSIALNAWNRIEGFIVGSTSVGQIELKAWTSGSDFDAGSSPDITHTSAATLNTTGTAVSSRYGIVANPAGAVSGFWLDDFGLTDQGYLGPAAGTSPSSSELGSGAENTAYSIGVSDAVGYPFTLSHVSDSDSMSGSEHAGYAGVPYLAAESSAVSGSITVGAGGGSATKAGDAIFITANASSAISAVSDSQGNTYLQLNSNAGSDVYYFAATFKGSPGTPTAALSTSDTISFTGGGSGWSACVGACAGIAPWPAVVNPAFATGSTTPAAQAIVPNAPGDMVLGFLAFGYTPSSVTWQNSFTEIGITSGSFQSTLAYLLAAAGSSVTAQAALGTNGAWVLGTASFATNYSYVAPSVPFLGPVMHVTFDPIQNPDTGSGGMAGFALNSSYESANTVDFSSSGGSPQTKQTLPCHFEAFTDYLQEFPWPATLAMMSTPFWTAPANTGLTGNVAALYYGAGAGTGATNGGYPTFESQLTNPGALTSLPVPAGSWAGAPKLASGSAAIPAVPMVGWNLGSALLTDIAAGVYDTDTIIPAAQACAAWPADSSGNPGWPGQPGGQVLIRLMHEFNLTGSGYCPGAQSGSTTAAFVAAWQHIVDVFAAQGATNARWCWCPAVASSGAGTPNFSGYANTSGTVALMYPGDAYVDYAGFDVYNQIPPTWVTFQNRLAPSYNWMYSGDSHTSGPITRKPMIIGEFGCWEDDSFTSPPETKAQWFTDMLTAVPAYFPKIAGLYYWHSDGGTGGGLEFYATSTAASTTAFSTLATTWTGRVPVIQGVTAAI